MSQKVTFRRLAMAAAALAGALLLAAFLLTSSDATVVEADSRFLRTLVSGRVLREESVSTVTRGYSGAVEANQNVDAAFELAGLLIEVSAQEGQRLESNAVIARLDTRALQAQKDGLFARRLAASEGLKKMLRGAREESIAAQRGVLEEASSRLELARLRLSRETEVHEAGKGSDHSLDQARLEKASLSGTVTAAREKLRELENGAREEDIAAQRALVSQIQAEVVSVDLRLEKSVLRAPWSGTVAATYADPGSVVAAGQPIVRLVEADRPQVRVALPVDVADRLRPRESVRISVGGATYPGHLRAVLPELNRITRTVTALVDFDQRVVVTIGRTAKVWVEQKQKIRGFWLPVSALQKGQQGAWVCFVLERGGDPDSYLVRARPIQVVKVDGAKVFVSGQIEDGQTIIADGLHKVVPGQEVCLASHLPRKTP